MEETLTERLRRMADRLISERPSDRVLNFTLDDQKYWIKRKVLHAFLWDKNNNI